jgi:hypothetical protein
MVEIINFVFFKNFKNITDQLLKDVFLNQFENCTRLTIIVSFKKNETGLLTQELKDLYQKVVNSKNEKFKIIESNCKNLWDFIYQNLDQDFEGIVFSEFSEKIFKTNGFINFINQELTSNALATLVIDTIENNRNIQKVHDFFKNLFPN